MPLTEKYTENFVAKPESLMSHHCRCNISPHIHHHPTTIWSNVWARMWLHSRWWLAGSHSSLPCFHHLLRINSMCTTGRTAFSICLSVGWWWPGQHKRLLASSLHWGNNQIPPGGDCWVGGRPSYVVEMQRGLGIIALGVQNGRWHNDSMRSNDKHPLRHL